MNQCDGCRRHLPIIDGIHMDFGYDMIGCTKNRYTGGNEMLNDEHHKAIAEIVKKNTPTKAARYILDIRIDTAYDLADYFAQDNEQFDRAEFLEACGL